MTNFEKLKSDKSEMAYAMMCPYGDSDRPKDCQEKPCAECCMEWLEKEWAE